MKDEKFLPVILAFTLLLVTFVLQQGIQSKITGLTVQPLSTAISESQYSLQLNLFPPSAIETEAGYDLDSILSPNFQILSGSEGGYNLILYTYPNNIGGNYYEGGYSLCVNPQGVSPFFDVCESFEGIPPAAPVCGNNICENDETDSTSIYYCPIDCVQPTAVLSIKSGWNLISFPYEKINVLKTAATTCPRLTFYNWNSELQKWEVSETVKGGKGYWIYNPLETDCKLAYVKETDTTPEISVVGISEGWNEIGSFVNNRQISDVLGNCAEDQFTLILYYNTETTQWERLDTSGNLNTHSGYWVLSEQTCELRVQ